MRKLLKPLAAAMCLAVVITGCKGKEMVLNDDIFSFSSTVEEIQVAEEQKIQVKSGPDMQNVEGTSATNVPSDQDKSDTNSQAVQDKPAGTGNLKVYEDSTYGIKVQYPENWKMDEKIPGVAAILVNPRNGSNLNIMLQWVTKEYRDLKKYTDLGKEQLKKMVPGYTEIEQGETKLVGEPAFWIIYTGEIEGQLYKWKQLWTIKDEYAYLITFVAAIDDFDSSVKDADIIVANFEITSKPNVVE